MEDKLLSIDEVARYLKIPKSTIYKLSQKKELPSSKIGKQLRFRRSSLDNWLTLKEAKYKAKSEEPSSLAEPAPPTETQLKNVLLIDDDKLVLTTITKFLKLQGYNVEPLESGEEALKRIEEENLHFDLAIVDVKMPGIDGIETIKRLRAFYAKYKRPNIPEIVITGYIDTEAQKQATQLGITDYIHKPFLINEFISTVNRKFA